MIDGSLLGFFCVKKANKELSITGFVCVTFVCLCMFL